MKMKKGTSIKLPTMTSIDGNQLHTDLLNSSRLYLSFLHHIDCLLCNVHIFNMAFEKEKYFNINSKVIFILDSEPKDVRDFVQEHPNFSFSIVLDKDHKLFNEVGLPRLKKNLLGLKKESLPMADLLVSKAVIQEIKYYKQDKDHLDYSQISSFLQH